jgi:hypothetical protein
LDSKDPSSDARDGITPNHFSKTGNAMKIRKYIMALTILVMFSFIASSSIANPPPTSTYGTIVDDVGNITLPGKFREDWTFLGTWSIAQKDVKTSSEASGHGAAGLHNVYTQHGVVESFRQNGKFPDGTVIIKELLKADTASMTTGTVSRGGEVEGWFVMIKDTKGRFSSNPLWGDGWGWVLFNNDQTGKPVTKNYKTECIGCHIPAREDDWIYLSGYPVLAD